MENLTVKTPPTILFRLPTAAVEKMNALAAAAHESPGEYFSELIDKQYQIAEPYLKQSELLAREIKERSLA